MNIDQREISSYVTYTSLSILFLGALIILYMEIFSTNEDIVVVEPLNVPAVKNVLTTTEVDFEKQKLTERSSANPPEMVFIEVPAKEIKFSATEEPPSFVNQSVIEIPDGVKPEQMKKVRVYDPLADSNNYTSSNSSSEKVLLTIEGTIYSKNNNTLVVAQKNGSGFGIVHVDSSTETQINGKPMSFSDLKVGDKVLAEGFGESGTAELTATVIIFTGFLQVMPF